MRGSALVLAGLLAASGAGAAKASLRQLSYDPANAETKAAAGGVTFLIDQGMFGQRVLKMRATEAKATADLTRADPSVLGRGALATLGPAARDRALYAITEKDDGPALVAALCPGSKHGWIALGRVAYGADLQAVVLGDPPGGGAARRCRTLDFSFRGEWRLPAGAGPAIEAEGPPEFPN